MQEPAQHALREAINQVRAGAGLQTVQLGGMRVTLCAPTKPLSEQDLPEPFPPSEPASADPLADWLS